jgi:hypothetical protein
LENDGAIQGGFEKEQPHQRKQPFSKEFQKGIAFN